MSTTGTARRGRGRGFGENRAGASRSIEGVVEVERKGQAVKAEVAAMQAMFPQWSVDDLTTVLFEAKDDLELAISRIVDGQAGQFSSVPGKKSRSVMTSRQAPSSVSSPEVLPVQPSNGGRGGGRGGFGGRGRGVPGGRGGFRGARGAIRPAVTTNGHAPSTSSSSASWPSAAATFNAETILNETSRDIATASIVSNGEDDNLDERTLSQTSTQLLPKKTLSDTDGSVDALAVKSTATQPDNDRGWDGLPSVPLPSNKVKIPSKVIQPGSKISWAQIARPPPPQPKTEAKPSPAPVTDVYASESKIDMAAAAEEALPLLPSEPVKLDSLSTTQDPWAATSLASTVQQQQQQDSSELVPLGVGEGWADAVIAQDDAALLDEHEDIEQHKRAEAAAPPAGVDPAGPLDVHTPVPEALPSQQPAFNLPSALEGSSSIEEPSSAYPMMSVPTDKLGGPPGLTKRSMSRMQQDAPVIISGVTGSSDIDRAGVQFGSLNLFGNSESEESPAFMPQPNPQLPVQKSLYETPAPPEQLQHREQNQIAPAQQIGLQAGPFQSLTDQNQIGSYPQASAQRDVYLQGRNAALPAYGQQQQQQQQPPQSSGYASSYSQIPAPFPQQGQQQPQQDPFASLSSASAAAGSPYTQQQGHAMHDAMSPYFSSQQSQQISQAGQQVTPSPVPASTRDTSIAACQTGLGPRSAYGGFTSAINQATHQQHGYSNDYAGLYSHQDPMRNLAYYNNQYEQQSQSRSGASEEAAVKLGTGAPASNVGANSNTGSQHQQPQQPPQQQQQFPPNFAPYGYYQPYYGMQPYAQQGMNPSGYAGYPSHSPYAPYPGYGAPGNSANRAYPDHHQQQQQQQQNSLLQGGYRGGYGTASNTGGAPHPAAYGSAYGNFNNSRAVNQGQAAGSQDSRNPGGKDVFGDRFFTSQY